MKGVSVKLPEEIIEKLNELVEGGYYPSRSTAIRAAIRDLVKKEVWNIRST